MIKLPDDKKIVIIGAGRSGTTYLVQLLTRMEFDTGFTPYDEPYREDIRAGCETTPNMPLNIGEKVDYSNLHLDHSTAPTVMKSPTMSFFVKDFVQKTGLQVAYALIPVRDMHEATLSRIDSKTAWDENEPKDYKDIFTKNTLALGSAIEACVTCGIPYQTMHYPTFTKDMRYSQEILIQMYREVGIDLRGFGGKHKKAFKSLLRK